MSTQPLQLAMALLWVALSAVFICYRVISVVRGKEGGGCGTGGCSDCPSKSQTPGAEPGFVPLEHLKSPSERK